MAESGEGKEGAEPGSVGVIVCDHGSRRENANKMLFEVAERYRSFSGFDIVEVSEIVRGDLGGGVARVARSNRARKKQCRLT